jgi:hypothetical protein
MQPHQRVIFLSRLVTSLPCSLDEDHPKRLYCRKANVRHPVSQPERNVKPRFRVGTFKLVLSICGLVPCNAETCLPCATLVPGRHVWSERGALILHLLRCSATGVSLLHRLAEMTIVHRLFRSYSVDINIRLHHSLHALNARPSRMTSHFAFIIIIIATRLPSKKVQSPSFSSRINSNVLDTSFALALQRTSVPGATNPSSADRGQIMPSLRHTASKRALRHIGSTISCLCSTCDSAWFCGTSLGETLNRPVRRRVGCGCCDVSLLVLCFSIERFGGTGNIMLWADMLLSRPVYFSVLCVIRPSSEDTLFSLDMVIGC